MKSLGRRGLLKALAASPVSAHAFVEQVKAGQMGIGLGGGNLGGACVPTPTSQEAQSFTSFAKWLANHGEKHIREQAKYVRQLDAELIEMRLPLATKIRMQRERNYRRLLDERREWFDREISLHGMVEWWA